MNQNQGPKINGLSNKSFFATYLNATAISFRIPNQKKKKRKYATMRKYIYIYIVNIFCRANITRSCVYLNVITVLTVQASK